MKEPFGTLRKYANDMIAVHRHVLEAMTRHAEDPSLARVPGAQAVVAQAVGVLGRHIDALERRVEALGGRGALGEAKEVLTSVTGFVTGLYGQVRGETASRMLRDDYTGLHFLLVCAAMLDATCRALRDEETAAITAGILRDLPPILLRLNELVPRAVVVDIAREHPDVTAGAEVETAEAIRSAWRSASLA